MEEKPRLTVGALVLNKREMLLLKSHKWKDKYIFPSGHVDFMESLKDAVKRETKEETGLDVKEIEFLTINEYLNSEEYEKKGLHFVGMQYTCESENREVKLNDEAEEYIWISPKESLKLDLEWGTKKAIECYIKEISIIL